MPPKMHTKKTLLLLQDGRTPLYVACQIGYEAVVKLLLDGGSDVNKAAKVSKI